MSDRQPTISLVRRFRAVLWLVMTALGLTAIVLLMPYASRSESRWADATETGPGLPRPWARPRVIYGWRVVPPSIDIPIEPELLAAYAGDTAVCTVRQRTTRGWYCIDVAFLPPFKPYVFLAPDSPATAAPCSQRVAPGGTPFPCPGGWIQ